jgi:hypothetical protein
LKRTRILIIHSFIELIFHHDEVDVQITTSNRRFRVAPLEIAEPTTPADRKRSADHFQSGNPSTSSSSPADKLRALKIDEMCVYLDQLPAKKQKQLLNKFIELAEKEVEAEEKEKSSK